MLLPCLYGPVTEGTVVQMLIQPFRYRAVVQCSIHPT